MSSKKKPKPLTKSAKKHGLKDKLSEDELKKIYGAITEIAIISQLSSNAMQRVLPDGMSIAQLGVLNHMIRVHPVSSPLRLARAFQVTKGAMTNTVKRLQDQGFVRVRPDPRDGRGKLVEITDSGRAHRDEAIRLLVPTFAEIGSRFGVRRFDELLPLLQDLRIVLDQERAARDFGDLPEHVDLEA